MTKLERAMLDYFDPEIVLCLLKNEGNSYHLTEDFVNAVLVKVLEQPESWRIQYEIIRNQELMSQKLLTTLFESKNVKLISLYMRSLSGRGMDSEHVIALIELANDELIDYFFKLYAPLVFEDEWYSEVVRYLKMKGLFTSYRQKYMPRRKLGK